MAVITLASRTYKLDEMNIHELAALLDTLYEMFNMASLQRQKDDYSEKIALVVAKIQNVRHGVRAG